MASLPARRLGPPTAGLVANGPTVQVAEPLALGLVGPENPPLEWFVGPASAHPAASDPGGERAGGDAEHLGQLGAPPLIQPQPVAANRAWATRAEAEPLTERPPRRRPEAGGAPSRPEALGGQALTDDVCREPLVRQLAQPLAQRWVGAEVGQA